MLFRDQGWIGLDFVNPCPPGSPCSAHSSLWKGAQIQVPWTPAPRPCPLLRHLIQLCVQGEEEYAFCA